MLKKEIYSEECSPDNRIDRHKTIALYMQVFLPNPLFKVSNSAESDAELDVKTKLINEYFCCDFMYIVLKQWSGKRIDQEKFKEYEASLLKLLYNYKDYSAQYRIKFQENSILDKTNNLFTYMIAHIIYFIERDFCIAKIN